MWYSEPMKSDEPSPAAEKSHVPPAATAPPPPNAAEPLPPSQQPIKDPGELLGIIGLVCAFLWLSLIGIIFAAIGLKKSKQAGFSGTLSRISLWINIVFTVIGVLFIAGTIAVVIWGVNEAKQTADKLELDKANDVSVIEQQVQDYVAETGKIPISLDQLGLSSEVLENFLGYSYTYTLLPENCVASIQPPDPQACTKVRIGVELPADYYSDGATDAEADFTYEFPLYDQLGDQPQAEPATPSSLDSSQQI